MNLTHMTVTKFVTYKNCEEHNTLPLYFHLNN